MNFKTFLEHFDTIAEAPGGIPKLRSLILDMAVRGKLVPQNPEDEPAKVQSQQEDFSYDNCPYEISSNWIWATLSTVVNLKSGYTVNKDFELEKGNIPYLKVGDMNLPENLLEIQTSSRFVEKNSIISKNLIPPQSIIFPKRGGAIATNKKRFVRQEILIDTNIMALVCDKNSHIYLEYLWIWFSTIDLAILNTGTSVPQINNKDIAPLLIPLPPLAEQKRIVEKVDELMGLCDRFSSAKQTRDNLRQKLRESAIASLMNAETDEELKKGWAIVRDNWCEVSRCPEDVDGLRRSVLQLAVRGKLVSQDSSDEPTSILLESIQKEREKIIEKRIVKSKPLPEITLEEIIYSIPKTWSWARLSDICELITDGTHQTPTYTASGRVFISAQNVKPFRFMPENHKFVSEEAYQGYIKNRKPEYEDILLTRVGAGIGEAAVIDQKLDFAIYVSVGLIRPFKKFVNPHYITIWLNSPVGTKHSHTKTYGKGVSQGNLNLSLIRGFVVSIPPLAEQKRIVAKVDELMQLCDQLEASLRQSQQRAETLAASAISHLTI